ncbi:MAG: hypothetical protein PVH21_08755 [Myxococcales bacterium]|jgi:tetratricopeptide (TPR) repeat protein
MPLVSDFGFDGYALEGADAAGELHPLEIARDLIAADKPRSALEVLSLHYEKHFDEPGYLLLCAEAWRAAGDALRAQQALLGAARLAPSDPRPLEALSELLVERGEQDKAERVLQKARALERSALEDTERLSSFITESEEDLIAAAERQERNHQAALSPRQISMTVLALGALLALIGAIALLSQPRSEPKTSAQAAVQPGETLAPSAEPDSTPLPVVQAKAPTPPQEEIVSESAPVVEVAELEPSQPEPALQAPARAAAPPVEALDSSAARRARSVEPSGPRRSSAAPSRKTPSPPSTEDPAPEPDPSIVRAELGSMGPEELTRRADTLYAQGASALAASYYRRALEIDPDYAPALVGIGRGILRAERYEEAMSNATRALQLARGVDARPGLEAEAIYQMGRVHLERGEREAARQLLRQAVSMDRVPAEAWFYLGEALASENSPAARRAYERYLELVPTGSLADRAHRAIQ